MRLVRSLILDSPRRAFARMSLRDIPREAGRGVSTTALIGQPDPAGSVTDLAVAPRFVRACQLSELSLRWRFSIGPAAISGVAIGCDSEIPVVRSCDDRS